MKVIKAVFYPTAGHGYLAVPRDAVHVVGFQPSSYSTSDNVNYFLEEDCDASGFLAEAAAGGFHVDVVEYSQDEDTENYIDYLFERA